MTKEEIDILWNKALRQSVDDGTLYTRYRFAELVAEAEREACAKVCETEWSTLGQMDASFVFAAAIRARGEIK